MFKHLITIIFMTFSFVFLNAQERQIKDITEMIEKGPDRNGFYEVNFKKPIEEEDEVLKYLRNSNFYVLKTKTGRIRKWGDYQPALVGVVFIDNDQYQYLMELKKQKEAKEKIDSNFFTWIGAALTTYLVYKGGKYLIKEYLDDMPNLNIYLCNQDFIEYIPIEYTNYSERTIIFNCCIDGELEYLSTEVIRKVKQGANTYYEVNKYGCDTFKIEKEALKCLNSYFGKVCGS